MKGNDILKGLSEIDESYILEAAPKKNNGKKPILIRWVSLAAALCLVVGIVLYRGNMVIPVQATDLMNGVLPNAVDTVPLDTGKTAVTDFAVRLMQQCNQTGENTMISPISVLYALAMTANGAEGETLTQMETVLGMPLEALNGWLYTFRNTVDKDQMKLANSIWFTDDSRFQVNRNFLQTNADYYDAGVYQSEFSSTTLTDMNNWVKGHTDGMIPKILERIDKNDVMYLINAICFDAKWATPYKEKQVHEGTFTRENGSRMTVDFLYSSESYYLEDSLSRGFVKPYQGGRYAFVAMLPNEGVTVDEYLAGITGATIQNILTSKKKMTVNVGIPKFESDFSLEMSDVLSEMGMENAFDPDSANFTGLGTMTDGNLSIGLVIHKTYISLDEQGTKAAASTVVGVTYTTAGPIVQQSVILDRPFVYMIVDQATGIPVFIGTMMSPGK